MKMPSMPKWLWWVAIPIAFLVIIVIAASVLDEPLRAYAEREVNQRLPAYTVHIGALDLHPLTLSLDLEDVVVRQKERPDPPLAAISTIHGSLQWSALLRGRLVTDEVVDHPVIHFTRPQAAKEAEAS